MRINWFSPLPPAPTDIAHYTVRTLSALAQRAEVILWTDQAVYDKNLEKLARVRRFQGLEINWTEYNQADLSFYHIGNNTDFHLGIWQWSQRAPGVVVLHDQRLHQFFDSFYRDLCHDRAGYFALMEKFHGPESLVDAASCYDTNAANIMEMVQRYPLTLAACEGALGVLTHARGTFEAVKKEAQLPVAYAPLPFAAPPLVAERSVGPPFRLIMFGHLGRNRRLAQAFAALGGMPEKERFRLDIYGEITSRAEVEAAIDKHGLRGITQVHGFVPEDELEAALQRSHLAFNLRFPTMGEASGSQLRIWSHALPALVTKIGWYAGLPANTVLFVRQENEMSDIRQHLRDFLVTPERFAAIGAQGREVLENEHAPETYADSLIIIAEHAQAWRGRVWAYDLAERAAGLLSAWDGRLSQEKTAREIALLAGWQKPSAMDYAQAAMVTPPVSWRERVQQQLDRWLLGAKE